MGGAEVICLDDSGDEKGGDYHGKPSPPPRVQVANAKKAGAKKMASNILLRKAPPEPSETSLPCPVCNRGFENEKEVRLHVEWCLEHQQLQEQQQQKQQQQEQQQEKQQVRKKPNAAKTSSPQHRPEAAQAPQDIATRDADATRRSPDPVYDVHKNHHNHRKNKDMPGKANSSSKADSRVSSRKGPKAAIDESKVGTKTDLPDAEQPKKRKLKLKGHHDDQQGSKEQTGEGILSKRRIESSLAISKDADTRVIVQLPVCQGDEPDAETKYKNEHCGIQFNHSAVRLNLQEDALAPMSELDLLHKRCYVVPAKVSHQICREWCASIRSANPCPFPQQDAREMAYEFSDVLSTPLYTAISWECAVFRPFPKD